MFMGSPLQRLLEGPNPSRAGNYILVEGYANCGSIMRLCNDKYITYRCLLNDLLHLTMEHFNSPVQEAFQAFLFPNSSFQLRMSTHS